MRPFSSPFRVSSAVLSVPISRAQVAPQELPMSTNESRNPVIRVVHGVLVVALSVGALCVAASNAGVAVRAEKTSPAPEGVRPGDDGREGSVWVVNRDRG